MSRNKCFSRLEYHMFYVLYPFVTYLLTLPRKYTIHCLLVPTRTQSRPPQEGHWNKETYEVDSVCSVAHIHVRYLISRTSTK
jgi:hypothetical protein